MTEAVAAVLVVGGAALAALGSIGVLRFPDVLTRMHASTKAAGVGLIATTAAALLVTDGTSDILQLLLVVLLLFLTTALSTSVLARAAYNDPETPKRIDGGDDLAAAPQIERFTSPEGRGRPWFLALVLAGIWVVLYGTSTLGVIAAGIVVGSLVTAAMPRFWPVWPAGFLRPVAAIRFGVVFLRQFTASTLDVVVQLFKPVRSLHTRIVGVPLRLRTPTAVTLLMNAVTFSPGTIAIEACDGEVFVHALNAPEPERIVASVMALEERIGAGFAPYDRPTDTVDGDLGGSPGDPPPPTR
jgi:multicomponent Na+:H+ antiporter subunit G